MYHHCIDTSLIGILRSHYERAYVSWSSHTGYLLGSIAFISTLKTAANGLEMEPGGANAAAE